MSTFNGIVDEFPDIRIDFFRYHPGRTLPSACFLSHVHSDHLQGLETLKMPFVYCSLATRKILLRMEKYPHRINFAKGILEVRKQTYKALRLVLRALPLETPVEIELGPKSKIRVTMFDANHCPGSVMFLIEGSDKAILYTGDVRAEPWWVNTIVRNPVLLPYSCGVKKLDCIYLDTTFASRSDVYEHFPSKAEGLKELLAKASNCPKSSIFYFRSWTLGYEDVWIALSNFLQSHIHVDDYQLRLFRSLAEDTQNTDKGPALAGFAFGNQQQLGCLTNDTSVSIHSCEPGTDCHEQIKKMSNVVWITPIISRLKNGVEIEELGAGGGGGDLYQTPELEVIDEAAFGMLLQLCANDTRHMTELTKLGAALATARDQGHTNVPLEGLQLDQDEEISLKQFLQLVSQKDKSHAHSINPLENRTIHFPYSRHSSYSELRHLISSFNPKDICPCTVDIDTWTEEVSMQALFGGLCSESLFRYDEATRLQAKERQEARSKKRKREIVIDSQETASQDSILTEAAYGSAQTSIQKGNELEQEIRTQPQAVHADQDASPMIPTPVRELKRALAGVNGALSMFPTQGAGQATTIIPTTHDRSEIPDEEHAQVIDLTAAVSISPIPTLTSITQPCEREHTKKEEKGEIGPDQQLEDDDDDEAHSAKEAVSAFHLIFQPIDTQQGASAVDNAHHTRKRAYEAAILALRTGDFGQWTDLRLRSVGWKGHSEEEVELGSDLRQRE